MKKHLVCRFLLLSALALCIVVSACGEGVSDGAYAVRVTSNAEMFRVAECYLLAEGGSLTARMTLSGSGYGYLYPGTAEQAARAAEQDWLPFAEDASGRHVFLFPVASLDTPVPAAAYSIKYAKWYDRELTFHASSLEPLTEEQAQAVFGTEEAVVPADGDYTADAATDSALLKFSRCTLHVQNGAMTAKLVLSKGNFSMLYPGLAKNARQDEANWIAQQTDDEGSISFVVPIESLDRDIPLATYSPKRKAWYDRTVRIDAASLQRIETEENPEGGFVPDAFAAEGGTGKVTITCPQLREGEDGRLDALIVFSSPNYTYVRIGETVTLCEHDGNTSFAWVAAPVNETFALYAETTAMSTAHEIEYRLLIEVERLKEHAEASALPGLTWSDRVALQYAEGFTVDLYEGGFTLIDVAGGERWLVVPEGQAAPEGIDPAIRILRQPLEHIYLAATSAMALFDRLDAMDAIRLSGTKASGWYSERAAQAMEDGKILYAGKYSEPDFELLLLEHCDLAVESMMITHTPKAQEMLEVLKIPVFVDRSSSERHPLGRAEWIKLYGALTGKLETAEAAFARQVAAATAAVETESSGLTVAFFSMRPDGTAVVRGSEDYVPEMLREAGGVYAFQGLEEVSGSSASIPLNMEAFLQAVTDADIFLYNGAIDQSVQSVQALLERNPLLSQCGAVAEGRVYRTQPSFYQATDVIGELILDMRRMMDGEDEALVYIEKLPTGDKP